VLESGGLFHLFSQRYENTRIVLESGGSFIFFLIQRFPVDARVGLESGVFSGMSVEAVRTRQMWERLVIDAAAAGPTPPVAAKNFKPKFPDIPVRDEAAGG
jgi:hypothetical protein